MVPNELERGMKRRRDERTRIPASTSVDRRFQRAMAILLFCFSLLGPASASAQGRYAADDDAMRRQNALNLARIGMEYLINGDHVRAYGTLGAAADEGSGEAASALATMQYMGLGQPADRRAAERVALRAAEELDDPLGARIYAWLKLQDEGGLPDSAAARKFFRAAAEQGDAIAMYYLAQLLEQGALDAAPDRAAAARWYENAALHLLPHAMWRFGELLINGGLGRRDISRGTDLLVGAARAGVIPAMVTLANQYYRGVGLIQNYGEAFSYYCDAAELGHPEAQNMTGFMILNDLAAVERSAQEERARCSTPADAVHLLMRAAGQAHPEALFNLGLYFYGRDDVLAHAYFNLAASRGVDKAVAERGQIEAQMTSVEVREAQLTASNWPFEQDLADMKQRASGSGLFVSYGGTIVTNQHVVSGCDALMVNVDGASYRADLIAAIRETDLALLRLIPRPRETLSFRVARLARGDETFIGSEVGVFGWPLDQVLSAGGVFTAGTLSALEGERGNPNDLQFSAPVQPGNSGGPIFGESGSVVGVVKSKLPGAGYQNVNFAVKSSVVQKFLKQHGQAYYIADIDKGQRYSSRKLAELGRRIAVKVICREYCFPKRFTQSLDETANCQY